MQEYLVRVGNATWEVSAERFSIINGFLHFQEGTGEQRKTVLVLPPGHWSFIKEKSMVTKTLCESQPVDEEEIKRIDGQIKGDIALRLFGHSVPHQ